MPDISLMLPLCEEFQISVNELLTGEKMPEVEFKASLVLSNRLVTGPYMTMGNELFGMLDGEIWTAENSDSIELFKGNVPNEGKCFDYPVCLILTDEQGNVIAQTDTDTDSESYQTCLQAALDGRNGRTGFLEASTSADRIVYLASFICAGQKYVISAYSQIDQLA